MISQYVSDLWTTYYDPWYGWAVLGFLVAVGASWLAWLFPVLRSLAGAVVIGVFSALAGMWKGKMMERDRWQARERNRDRWWR